ncbi:hypothetical protein Ancab_019229 [Ancistrocladus abbreviatus]
MLLKSHTFLFVLFTFFLLISPSLQQSTYGCPFGCCSFSNDVCIQCCVSLREAEEFKATAADSATKVSKEAKKHS